MLILGDLIRYYVNTANFYRQIRNIIIEIRKVSSGSLVTCLHYQVAQATSLQNVELIAAPGSSQIGLFAENGSGGGISDVTFTGGGIGLKGGNQQFTAQRLTFNGCTVGIQVIWDWGWVWKSITMNNVGTGFQLVGDGGVGNSECFPVLFAPIFGVISASFRSLRPSRYIENPFQTHIILLGLPAERAQG